MTRIVIINLTVLLIFWLSPGNACADDFLIAKKDLSSDWMVYQTDGYRPYTGQLASTIYIDLNSHAYAGDYLKIQSNRSFHVFINGQLAATGQSMVLPIDSLTKLYSAAMQIGIHQKDMSSSKLTTLVLSKTSEKPSASMLDKHKSASFRDFAIVAAIVLMLLLITMIRLNPKLATDYFSIRKIFTTYEGEDNQMYSRMTSSTNILFYVFCSLMLSYYMMIIFQFVAGRYPIATSFQADTFGTALLHWLELSVVLLLLFFTKIVLVYGLSLLFGLQGVAGIHFFNWVRLVLVVFGVATIIMSFYFISRGQNENFFGVLLKFLSWTLIGWMFLILFKLRSRSDHSLFHLFSYICATELIPFLFIIKILYN
jgi:hypothetical protein